MSACTPANKRLYARQALVRQALVRPRSLHAHTDYSYLTGVGTCGAAPLDTFLFLPFLPPALKCVGANSTNTVKLPYGAQPSYRWTAIKVIPGLKPYVQH